VALMAAAHRACSMTRRLRTPLLVSAIAFLTAPTTAQAGTYDVLACDAAVGGVNRAWTYETNDPERLESGNNCPASQSYSGAYARTKLGSGDAPTGSFGHWVLRAPTGTTITRLQLTRWLGMEAGSGWRLFGRQADGTTLDGETCVTPSGSYECNVGGYNSSPINHSLNTTLIVYGIECVDSFSCSTGATIHAARAAIYSARVTLSESTSPTVTNPSGALVTESGYHRGTETATFAGSDSTSGLSAQRVYIDGVVRASHALACDYTYVVPCSNPTTAQTLSVDLAATSGGSRVIPDGTRSVEVAAVDAAGNETRSTPRSIVVDGTAPAAASALTTSAGSNWQSTPGFTATWTHPAGQVAPIDTAHWTLCPSGTTTGCTNGSAPVSASTGTVAGLQVPGEGAWDFSLRLQDAAGNTSAANVARTTVRYDATAPTASSNLAIANRAETDPAFLAWFNPPSGQQAPVTRAIWTLCPQSPSTGCGSGTLSTDPASTSYLRAAVPRHGDWTLSVRLRDEAGNLGAPATRSLRYIAAPTPTPAPTVAPLPPPDATPTPARRASAKLRVASAVLGRSRRVLVVKGTAASTASGRIALKIIIARPRSRTLTRSALLRNGRFVLRVRVGRRDVGRRLRVSAAYQGSATHAPARTSPRAVRIR
jgi:hypothetical protein